MKNILMSIAVLMLVCCEEAEATSEKNIVNKVIKPETTVKNNAGSFADYTPVKTVKINLDDMSFEEAFGLEHRAKGEGRTFWWRGDQYTTNLAVLDEFVLNHVTLPGPSHTPQSSSLLDLQLSSGSSLFNTHPKRSEFTTSMPNMT